MFNLIKFLYRLYRKPFIWLGLYFRRYFYFIIPNRIKLLRHRVVLVDFPAFNQITLCEGAGIVEIGKGCSFGYKPGGFHRGDSIELQARYKDAKIKIGDKVSTNNNIMLCSANYIEIGDDTLIGQYVTITDFEAHGIDPLKRSEIGTIGKVIIGKNAWIGSNVTILKNSEIGDNTIIATGAVVSGKFPADVIIGGIPAKIIKAL